MANTPSGNEVAKRTILPFNDDALREMVAFGDLDRFFEGASVTVESIAEYGTGFTVLKTLDALCGVPLVFIQWREESGDYGTFVIAHVITQTGGKYVVPNGSVKSGLAAQLISVAESRMKRGQNETTAHAGLYAPNGLVRSDYDWTDAEGVKRPAVTYYIAE